MKFVRYVLVPFGLSFKFKALDQVLSGLYISILAGLIILVTLSIPTLNNNLLMSIMKIIGLMSLFSILWAYILMKKRIEKFYGMYDEICASYHNIIQNKKNVFTPIIISCICFCLCYSLTFVISIYSVEFNKVFKPFNMSIKFCYHGPITGLMCSFSIFSFQFIIYELCDKYYDLLEFSNQFIEKFLKYKPDFVIRYQVREVIQKFGENENVFNLIVYPMRRLIILIHIFLNFFMISRLKHFNEINACLFTQLSLFSLLFVYDFYLIYTQTVICLKSRIKNKFLSNIDTWINSSDDHSIGNIVTNYSPTVLILQNNDEIL